MSFTKYAKKTFDWDDLSAHEVFEKLSEYFLRSGFMDDFRSSQFSLDDLREALKRALMTQAILPLEELERMLQMEEEMREAGLSQLIDQLIDKMIEEGYLSVPDLEEGQGRGFAGLPGQAPFEITDKGLDFLGFKSLQETLAKVGRDAFGRHTTDRLATGVEAADAAKPYEFGDAMNLDATASLLEAVKRNRGRFPLELEESDLRVRQGELQVAAATVVMLDCSHSMILYGEDRFTPAKRVALALSHLIRTRYPGDELSLILFHDSAEEVPIVKLPQVQIGPFHTNTAEGLKLARKVLARSRRQLRQIIMITDGKPSALTLPDGRIYKNSFGLDPFILRQTFKEVADCRRSNIRINTFMLARDRALIAFVKRMSEIARGKAYFTTPFSLGSYVTLDFMNNKVELLN